MHMNNSVRGSAVGQMTQLTEMPRRQKNTFQFHTH